MEGQTNPVTVVRVCSSHNLSEGRFKVLLLRNTCSLSSAVNEVRNVFWFFGFCLATDSFHTRATGYFSCYQARPSSSGVVGMTKEGSARFNILKPQGPGIIWKKLFRVSRGCGLIARKIFWSSLLK